MKIIKIIFVITLFVQIHVLWAETLSLSKETLNANPNNLKKKQFRKRPRIVGGTISDKDSWPWMLGLVVNEKSGPLCGASLIHPKWAITAAQCLESDNGGVVSNDKFKIVSGITDFSQDYQDNMHSIERIISHPEYDNYTIDNDIALLELSSSIAGIPLLDIHKGDLSNLTGIVLGWGQVVYNGSYSDQLREVTLPVVSFQTCKESTEYIVTDNMFCAGYAEGGKDHCDGDAGSPFVVYVENQWQLAGIVSWGEGCAEPGNYGFYTRVPNYISFIEQHVTLDESEIENQTIPPTGLAYTRFSYTEIYLSWEAIPYTQNDGFYEIWIATSDNENYTKYGETVDTLTKQYTLSGLDETLDYYIKLRTITTKDDSVWESEFSQRIESKTFDRKEREALISLYESTNGDNWKKKDGWLGPIGTECYDWFGVSCDNDNKTISRISFSSNNLSGNISEQIGNLTNLTSLALRYNPYLTIPKEIGNLTNLTYLDISYNSYNYNSTNAFIQEQLIKLTNLEYLNLQNNKLQKLPEQIGNLTNLTSLTLSGNQLTNIPETIRDLTKLRTLDLSHNQLTHIPEQIGELTNLISLNLQSNRLTEISERIEKLTVLRYLKLSYNQLTEISEQIGNLSNLSDLDLYFNHITDLPENLMNLEKLDALQVGLNCINIDNADLREWLNVFDKTWEISQTIPPKNITVNTLSYTQVYLSWDKIPYSGSGSYSYGFYEIWLSTSENSGYEMLGKTHNKETEDFLITHLNISTTYYMKVRTKSYRYNTTWTSEFSPPIQILLTLKKIQIVTRHNVFENEGLVNNIGVLYIPEKTSTDLTINLISEDPSILTVQNSVTIPQGYTSTNFSLSTIDNDLINGAQYVMITATALNYTPASAEILIHDNDFASLSVNIPKSLSETDISYSAQASVICSHRVDNDIDINLKADDLSRLSVPEYVTIPKGLTSVVFGFYVIGNNVIDGNKRISVTASAESFYSGVTWIEIQDDENRNLHIYNSLQNQFNEATSHYQKAIKIELSGNCVSDLVISLNNSHPSELTLQKTVTIPSGHNSTFLDLFVNKDELIDGNQSVTITAASPGWITDTVTIVIIDDEHTQISLTILESITENQGIVENFGNISISGILLYDLNVQLTVSDPTELTLSEIMVIPAGERSISFTATILDDILHDGSQSVEIKASAINFLTDEKNIVIHDSEVSSLSFNLPSELTEGQEKTAYIYMDSPADKNILVELNASHQKVNIPETIFIPKGYTIVDFQIKIIDDNFIDDIQFSDITAYVQNWHVGNSQIQIRDNEKKELMISLADPAIVVEGTGIHPNKGKVTIPGIPQQDLVVSLLSSDPSEVTVLNSFIIPQGKDEAEFSVYIPDDDIVDSAQFVSLTVSAPGWLSGTNQLIVFDNEMVFITTEDNENNAGEGLPDNDVGVCVDRFSKKHPIEFNIDVKNNRPVSSAYLSVFINDIDYPFEVNDIYLNQEKLGYAIGENNINYSTLFIIPDVSLINEGKNLVKILVDRAHIDNNWCPVVQNGQLIFDEALNVGTVRIKAAYSDSSEYTYGDSARIDLELITSLPSQNVRLELLLRNPKGKIMKFDTNDHARDYLIQKGKTNPYQWQLDLPDNSDQQLADLIDGIWSVNVSIYDSITQRFQCTKTISFSFPKDANKQPSISNLTPETGNAMESKAVLVTGTNFIENDTSCRLGNYPLVNQNIVNTTQITANVSQLLSVGSHTLICQTPYGTTSFPEAYTVLSPLISLSQHHIQFDKTYVNHTNTTTINITNIGNSPLSITQTHLSNSKHYTIQTNACDNHVLNPSESCQVTLMFLPATYGKHQTELLFHSNDPYTPVETININGTATLFDLSLQNCFLPYTSIAGESMAISWTVKNTEGYTTIGNQIHTIYVSSDNQPGNDTQLKVINTTKTLATETSYTAYAHIDFPDHLIGNQWIVLKVQSSNPDIEMSESNNTKIFGPVRIIDKTPPFTSFSADGSVFYDSTQYYARKGVQYRLNAQDMYGSVQTIEYQIDNSSFQPYTSAFTLNTDGDHVISFRSQDNSGNWEAIKTIHVKVEIPPDTPEGLEGKYNNSKIQLKWLPNDASDFSHYFVYNNQEKIPVGNNLYEIYNASISLEAQINTIYTFQVSAVNKIGIESNLSTPITVSAYPESFVLLSPHTETYVINPQLTMSGLIKENVHLGFCVNGQLQYSLVTLSEGPFEVSDILLAEGENVITCAVLDSNNFLSEPSSPITIHYIKRPRAPENLEAISSDTTITLHWNDTNETDIIGYYIYRNNEKLLYQFAPITQTSFTDTRLSNHMSYTYAVTCIDSKYIESMPTNPVVATPIAGDWKIQEKRKKRISTQMDTIPLFAPSQHNVITIDVINNRSPMRSRKFTVTADEDHVIDITDNISKKKRIKAGQQQAFAFTFDIVCLAEDTNHLLTFTVADDSGYESTITKLLSISTTLNKCQSCSDDQVVAINCPEKECMISMGCHPSSGCMYIQEEKTQCNIDIGDSGHIHFIDDNLCQTESSHFFSPYTSFGSKDSLPIEIYLDEASKISVGIYQTNSDWVKSLMHQQSITSEKISVEWDGKAHDGSIMDDGLYHLIIIRDDDITSQHIHVDNVYPKAHISHIFQQSETCIEIHGTATDPNIYTATIECLSCTETEFDIYMKPLPVSDDLIAVLNTNEMNASEYTICLKVADKAGNERIAIRQFNIHPSTGVYANDNAIVPGYQSVPDNPDIWVDDVIPEGSLTIDTWEWESDIRYSGDQSHKSPKQDGVHGHYFIRPNNPLHLSETDNIIQYVYISPDHPPLEILLQFYTGEGNGEHRAYWGENLIQTTGTQGSASLRFMGELPEKGRWTRLIIPAAQLDLAEEDVRGIAFVAYNGQIWWDRTTKSSTNDDVGYQPLPQLSSDYHTSSTIHYSVLHDEHINISVFYQEQLIKTLVDTEKEPGQYQIHWDWTDNTGNAVIDGAYDVKMKTASIQNLELGRIPVQWITSRIRFPYENTLLSGKIPIFGTAAAKDFDHFEVEYASAEEPDHWFLLNHSCQQAFDMNEWFSRDHHPYANLAVWQIDPALMTGSYIIRLTVFNKQGKTKSCSVLVDIAKQVDNNGAVLKTKNNNVCLTIPMNVFPKHPVSTKALVSIVPLKWSNDYPIPENSVGIDVPYMIKSSVQSITQTAILEMNYQHVGSLDEKTFRMYQWQSSNQSWTATNATINTKQNKLTLNIPADSCMLNTYAILSASFSPPVIYEPVYLNNEQQHIQLFGYSFPESRIEIFESDNLLSAITANKINGLFAGEVSTFDSTNITFLVKSFDMNGILNGFVSRNLKILPIDSIKNIIANTPSVVNQYTNTQQIINILQILSAYKNRMDCHCEFDFRNDDKYGLEEVLYLLMPDNESKKLEEDID